VALFIHGGFWRAFDPSSSSQLARGLNGRGIAVAMVGYDLCPIVTIADIIVQIRRACIFLWQRFEQRLLVTGHSAGGHLAAAMIGTDWQALYPKAPADLVPAGFALSGIFDLAPVLGLPVNQDLRLDAMAARRDSPLFWPVAPGRVIDAAVGDGETNEFKRQSAALAETWAGRGAKTRYAEFPGNHFTVLDALTDPANAMVGRIVKLGQDLGR
jgi:arylformamidase